MRKEPCRSEPSRRNAPGFSSLLKSRSRRRVRDTSRLRQISVSGTKARYRGALAGGCVSQIVTAKGTDNLQSIHEGGGMFAHQRSESRMNADNCVKGDPDCMKPHGIGHAKQGRRSKPTIVSSSGSFRRWNASPAARSSCSGTASRPPLWMSWRLSLRPHTRSGVRLISTTRISASRSCASSSGSRGTSAISTRAATNTPRAPSTRRDAR